MKPAEWEELLLGATEEVRKRVAPLSARGRRGREVGLGAAGDRTIYADKLAEDLLLKKIGRVRGVRVLSEEAGEAGDRGGETLAVVDPLDGSSNFVRGIPFYCTSVAIVERGTAEGSGVVEVGVVRDLVTGDVYAARRGEGAKKNGKPIRTAETAKITESVVGVDLSSAPKGLYPDLQPLLDGIKRQVHFGANALELCFLAEGKTDAFVDLRERMRITDFAAAWLIALEAGAEVTARDGGELSPAYDLAHRFSFVASANTRIHTQILERCARHLHPPTGR
ncbi:MAG: hypothetical protein JRN40_01760 [Nitrososphaerota archaeon]|nr:hypothetical protein [Nitrososphaerota archaeon]